jgi:hypothetical protein
MFSILYLTENEHIQPLLIETVAEHAKHHNIPFHSLHVAALPSLGKFVSTTITTPYTIILKETTYPHIPNIIKLLQVDTVPDCFCHHYVDNVIDVNPGYLIRTKFLTAFAPNPFTTFDDFSKNVTAYLTTIVGLNIMIRNGFNYLNFEASHYHTHHCDKCIESFTKSIVFTLANMTEKDIRKYHAILEKQRNGKNVQVAIALMIKDEEQKIKETLEFYKNSEFFPEVFILDTGSTDKTLEKVREWADEHQSTKLEIYEQPFVDFSTSRNYLLDKAYEFSKSEFIISIDCNDEMKSQKECIESLALYAHFPVVFIDQVWKSENSDPITFTNIRIVKNNGKYRWRYRVHEVLMADNDVPIMIRLIPEIHLFQFREPEYESIKSARYHRDLKFFLEDVEKYPEDKRLAYYLSQTYFFCQDFENCIASGKRRLALNKPDEYDEECYQTILRICKCKMFLAKPKYNVKKWWWYAWDYFIPQKKKDIEPLLQIAMLYEDEDVDTALRLYQLACDTSKPSYNLPVRHELYSFERYKRLADMYYKKRNFEEVYRNYNKIIDYGKENNQPPSQQLKDIDNMLALYYPSMHLHDKPVLVIYGGHFYDRFWDGKKFFEKTIALGGSESMVIKLAHSLTDKYHVFVFVHTDNENTYDNVRYLRTERFNDFMCANRVKHLILSRDASKILPDFRKNVEKVHLWMHDMIETSPIVNAALYDTLITLSPFHKKWYEEYLNSRKDLSNDSKTQLRKKLLTIPNFVTVTKGSNDISWKTLMKEKPSNRRFIYSSCPTRGLEQVVNDFVELQKTYPDAELYLYCDFNNDYVRSKMPPTDPVFVALAEKIVNTKGIYNVGRLPEEKFMEECRKANFWYYPTSFTETFCITAVQMMINGVIPIYSNVGALPNVIGDAGVVMTNNKSLTDIVKGLEREEQRSNYIKKGLEKSRQYFQTTVVKKEWNKLL